MSTKKELAVSEVEESPEPKTLAEVLLIIQTELEVPKAHWNAFGKYPYRSCEDILNALKPFEKQYDCLVFIDDEIVAVNDRIYVKATVKIALINREEIITSHGFAREPSERKGMDTSQITGTASSYARKYALNALFLIDDVLDSDVPYDKMDDAAMDYDQVEKAYTAFREVMDADVDVMDHKRVQEGWNRLTNDERQEVNRRFGKDRPPNCRKGYKAILKTLLDMTDADLKKAELV